MDYINMKDNNIDYLKMKDTICLITYLPGGINLPEVVKHWTVKTSSSFVLTFNAKINLLVIYLHPKQNAIDRIKEITGSKQCKDLAEIHSKEDVMVVRENGENHVQVHVHVHNETSEINTIIGKMRRQSIIRKYCLKCELKKDCTSAHQKQTRQHCNHSVNGLCYNNIECADCISAEEDRRFGNTIALPPVMNSGKNSRHSLEEVRDEERDPISLGYMKNDDENHVADENLKKDVSLCKSKMNTTKLCLSLMIISHCSSGKSQFQKKFECPKQDKFDEDWNGLKVLLRERTTLPDMLFHTNIFAYPIKRKGRRLSQRRQEAQQQAEELPRYPEQCTEGSEIQDRESRNYDIVTSTRPVFSERDSATATNTPIPVTPTLNLPYAQERALLERVQGQGQHGTAGGGGRTTPRHPQYEDQTARQRSFTTWPATAHQAPARMVVFGLFYTGQQDLVRCYHCGIGLKDWSDGDEPLFEHIRHSPNCLFLRELLGEQLLNTYRENLAEAQRTNETVRSQESVPRPAQQPTRRVRHPGMTMMAQRLGTFNEWPQSTGQLPQSLAEAGLFFTGINDLCRCFTCDGGLQRWDRDDDPWLEHTRWFPHCSYVREMKGQEYIDMVQVAAQRAQLEEEESVVVRGLTNLDFQNTDLMESDAAKAVLEMGYSRAAVRLAIHEFNGRNPSQRTLRFTADELVQILAGRQERGEPIPDDDTDPEEQGASAGAAQNLPTDPMEENKRLKGILKCIMCKENDCNILLLPCTHHRLCEPCAESVTNCPACGRRVEERVKTYMA
ncbi:uncharacterized protein LOC128238227 [Mya arenaria]|uniref:uncharacterized protein LOC128238227 n=1 Tax=Mya arenaria TaxID=6604 RepID=UPI0022E6803E|nr:uncharacterized protein LOC128238227 [Mya arenaria]XP_052809868.1 uncharacterized protein LOC128238227 [Mya arenaria]